MAHLVALYFVNLSLQILVLHDYENYLQERNHTVL